MKILYGIQMTGNGHLTRSINIIRELKSKGIDVDIITSGTLSNVEIPFKIKRKFKGLTFVYNNRGGISFFKTLKSIKLFNLIKEIRFDSGEYDLIISDFEPISAWSAKIRKIKSIGIGNQYSFLSKNFPKKKYNLTNIFIKYFAPCEYNIGLDYNEIDEFIFKPVINTDILKKEKTEENFILVYLPSMSINKILDELFYFNEIKWKIYSKEVSFDKMITDNVQVCKMSNKFREDLLKCEGVITASGFSTTAETLILNKKLWSIPIKNQYEQYCNSQSLKKIGVYTKKYNKENIEEWLYKYDKVYYPWEDPTEQIVKKIISYYEN
jgi:uncharacterized protein (TIGR00661 family)